MTTVPPALLEISTPTPMSSNALVGVKYYPPNLPFCLWSARLPETRPEYEMEAVTTGLFRAVGGRPRRM